jgi:predicted extracellular nuclease
LQHLLIISPLPVQAADTNDLFFSEYIEGTSNNKALEIYNGTANPINLMTNNYVVQVYSNGATTPNTTTALTGIVASNDVFVISHTSANATISAQADQKSSNISYNGNDAVVLRKGGINGTILDGYWTNW